MLGRNRSSKIFDNDRKPFDPDKPQPHIPKYQMIEQRRGGSTHLTNYTSPAMKKNISTKQLSNAAGKKQFNNQKNSPILNPNSEIKMYSGKK